MFSSLHVHLVAGAGLLALLLGLAACNGAESEQEYAVRIGDAMLSVEELERAIEAVPQGTDPEVAREQYIEQWLTTQLLAREALRRGLRDDESVLRQIEDNERNVLASALLSSLYDEENSAFNAGEIETYFERNRDRMRIREPYVRVRYIEAETEGDAESARGELTALYRGSLTAGERDSLFALTASRYARDSSLALSLAASYLPQARLVDQVGSSPWSIVGQLSDRETSPVLVTSDSAFAVIQLVERIPAGAEARLEWMTEEIQRRLAIRHRQQAVAREVQRLRAEATARGELTIRPVPDVVPVAESPQ